MLALSILIRFSLHSLAQILTLFSNFSPFLISSKYAAHQFTRFCQAFIKNHSWILKAWQTYSLAAFGVGCQYIKYFIETIISQMTFCDFCLEMPRSQVFLFFIQQSCVFLENLPCIKDCALAGKRRDGAQSPALQDPFYSVRGGSLLGLSGRLPRRRSNYSQDGTTQKNPDKESRQQRKAGVQRSR